MKVSDTNDINGSNEAASKYKIDLNTIAKWEGEGVRLTVPDQRDEHRTAEKENREQQKVLLVYEHRYGRKGRRSSLWDRFTTAKGPLNSSYTSTMKVGWILQRLTQLCHTPTRLIKTYKCLGIWCTIVLFQLYFQVLISSCHYFPSISR